jgi:ADP-ribosylglycohydrolase
MANLLPAIVMTNYGESATPLKFTKLCFTMTHRGFGRADAVERWGTGSKSGQVLQLALYFALQYDDYAEAVRANMFAGGDVTARAHVVGALMGARHGYASVPKRWRKKANRRLELEQMVQMLLFQRTAVLPVALGGTPGQGDATL